MKYVKYLITAVCGMMICMQSAAAANYTHKIRGAQYKLHSNLAKKDTRLGTNSMFYTKVDTFHTINYKKLNENRFFPLPGLGWRCRNSHHGLDFSVSGFWPITLHIDHSNLKSNRDLPYHDLFNSRYNDSIVTFQYASGQIMYLYYSDPVSTNSFYFGGGLQGDRYSVEIDKTKDTLNFGFISGVIAAGYQFEIGGSIKSFLQLQASQPAFSHTRNPHSGYGLRSTSEWAPTVSITYGIGF